jgi:hypothetical protein
MAARKKTVPGPKELPQPVSETGARPTARVSRGRSHPRRASFPVAPPRSELPRSYAKMLGEIKQRIQQERLRVVLGRQRGDGAALLGHRPDDPGPAGTRGLGRQDH